VCNRSATATTFRISVAPAGAADATSHYLYYDTALDGNDTFIATIGITVATTDKIRVYAGAATLTFSAFGVEVA
jgi:Fe-S cluster assembly iron-binding protein IscA